MRLKAPRVSFNTLGRYPSLRSEAVKKSTTGVILSSRPATKDLVPCRTRLTRQPSTLSDEILRSAQDDTRNEFFTGLSG